MTEMKYNVGDVVHWNDPDEGLCSGYRTVTSIIDCDTVVLDHGTEAFVHELILHRSH